MIACAAGTLLSLNTRRKSHAAATLILLGAFAVALIIRMLTNQMLDILAAGQSAGVEFGALHHKTDIAYETAAILLLIAGIMWILILLASPARRVVETALV